MKSDSSTTLSWPPCLSKYEVEGESIGSGGYGKVFKVRNVETGNFFAIKQISKEKMGKNNIEKFSKNEIENMKKSKHPNLIQLIEHFETDSDFFLVLPFMDEGDAFRYLKNNKISENDLFFLSIQLLCGLKCLTDLKILHRDVKLENMLLSDKGETIVISDFGFSKEESEGGMTHCGTYTTMAPEVIQHSKYTFKVDVYSLGVCLYCLLAGKSYYKKKDSINAIKMTSGSNLSKPKGQEDFPDDLLDLLRHMTEFEPAARWTINECFGHNFFTRKISEVRNRKIQLSDLRKKYFDEFVRVQKELRCSTGCEKGIKQSFDFFSHERLKSDFLMEVSEDVWNLNDLKSSGEEKEKEIFKVLSLALLRKSVVRLLKSKKSIKERKPLIGLTHLQLFYSTEESDELSKEIERMIERNHSNFVQKKKTLSSIPDGLSPIFEKNANEKKIDRIVSLLFQYLKQRKSKETDGESRDRETQKVIAKISRFFDIDSPDFFWKTKNVQK